jgi:glutathione peroxidase
MKKLLTLSTIIFLAMSFTTFTNKTLHDFKCKTLDDKEFSFSSLKGKKIMIVNTASECGYTPQYKDLQALYEKYKNSNFVIIGFPCNDFGGQEPGSAGEIQSFCSKNYGVTFPLMEKVVVKGDNKCEIYKWLTSKTENGVEDSKVNWNFNKYLIDEKGNYVKHLGSGVNPLDKEVTEWIEKK